MKRLKDSLAAGHRMFGFNIRISRTAEAVAIARASGFDWLFIDMEHSALNLETVQTLCLAGLAPGLPPLVRVPDVTPISMNIHRQPNDSMSQVSSGAAASRR